MINRILIRIKVIQVLYSFLLVEKSFSLEGRPSAPTKEKRYAYSLYLDLLLLMSRIAESIGRRGGDKPLEDTRFIRCIRNDDTIKSLRTKYSSEPFPFESAVEALVTKVKDSAIYRNFLKADDANGIVSKETVWQEIFNLLIIPDERVNALIEERENFTLKGVDRTRDMMTETFSNFMASHDGGADALEVLRKSLDKARELYFRLMYLPVELTDLEERNLDERRYKYLVTEKDINPDLSFVENSLVKRLRECEPLVSYIEKNKLYWVAKEPLMADKVLKAILDSDLYRDYMALPERTPHDDCEFWRNAMKRIVFNNEFFLDALEEESVFWNDDLDIIGTFVLKSFRRLEEGAGAEAVLDKFKDEEDARFGDELIKAVVRNKEVYRGYIDEAIDRSLWESERLAFMDMVVIETALAEILNFPKIPLSVSINEYIEIAKSYSTGKSGSFVNGILADIIRKLQKEKILLK